MTAAGSARRESNGQNNQMKVARESFVAVEARIPAQLTLAYERGTSKSSKKGSEEMNLSQI